MRTYAFLLSGEHETLPTQEALSLLEIHSSSFREEASMDQCLVVGAEGLDIVEIGRRLAMTHSIIQVLSICDADQSSLSEAVRCLDLPRRRYRVRARCVKGARPAADEVERCVGSVLFGRGFRADLTRPEIELRAVVTDGCIVLGLEAARIDRGSFEARRPHKRPFFHPGVLMPRMARALVNLSQAREGERLLDPFAGTCGILIEACMIGVRGVGVEFSGHLVRGALCNLKDVDCDLVRGDAKCLPFHDSSFDAAVLDLPYGRSARIEADSKEHLLEEGLAELHRVIIPGRRMVIVADGKIDEILAESGFWIAQRHMHRVHRSLTRHIYVCTRGR